MNRSAGFVPPLLLVVVAACATPGASMAPSPTQAAPSPAAAASPDASPTVRPSPPSVPTITAAPEVATLCEAGAGEVALVINGKANIFGAGLEEPSDPGGGGAGLPPPVIELAPGAHRVLSVPCTDGQVNCCFGVVDGWSSPGGTTAFQTDIESLGGISGLIVGDRAIFLAGVFLTDAPPEEPAPDRLDQTGKTVFVGFEPEIGQTFVIGSGEGSSWVVPAAATRLYLGLVDGYFSTGAPGYYGNNSGWYEATVRVTAE